ncbi:MAG TPA: TlyA family RNA methyltransferase [Candidatus Acidoferrum sp.]|nr:TlyA family RNA methyltransferase [Candidatus Acidoferrum sp.]
MTAKPSRKRLDVLLVERGLADSPQKAEAMILAGEVRVDGARVDKAGTPFPEQAQIEVHSRTEKYASRGGVKLEGALADFGVAPKGRVCLDVGSSTGGFTDCLLQHGAARVYAIDVNVNQLAWKLRQDKRVIPIERNARELRGEDIPEPVDLIVVDVSFISVSKVLPGALAAAKPGADLLILVKPQFELPREDVGPGGIVSSPALHDKAVAAVREAAARLGLEVLGSRPSRLPGAEGNQEYFLHARKKSME